MNSLRLCTWILGCLAFAQLASAAPVQTLSCQGKITSQASGHPSTRSQLTVEIQDSPDLSNDGPRNVKVRMENREHKLWFTNVSRQDYIVHTDIAGESAQIYIPVQSLGKAGMVRNVRTLVTFQGGGGTGKYDCKSSLSEAGQVGQPGPAEVVPVSVH